MTPSYRSLTENTYVTMFSKLFSLIIFTFAILFETKANLTFKNAVVLCESAKVASDEQVTFITTVTANSLKRYLPFNEDCFKIEIKYTNMPTIYDGAFANINRVNYLVLGSNYIKEIHPGAFTNLTVLEGMSLRFNKLTEIQKGVFNNVAISRLFLSFNSISKIHPQAFDDMPTLEAVYLDNNRLTFIDNNWFKNTPKLHTLMFRQNLLEWLPGYAFKNLVPKSYNEPEIDLSNNLIKSVDVDAFKKPNRFKHLILANNHIRQLSEDWLEGVRVGQLDLSNNNLECLMGNNVLAGQHSTNFIGGNPWICSCLEEMKRKEENGTFGHIIAGQDLLRCSI